MKKIIKTWFNQLVKAIAHDPKENKEEQIGNYTIRCYWCPPKTEYGYTYESKIVYSNNEEFEATLFINKEICDDLLEQGNEMLDKLVDEIAKSLKQGGEYKLVSIANTDFRIKSYRN